jgi:malonate decarboxylase epsilon subunit
MLDTPSALTDTRNVQLALLICGVAWGRYLQTLGCTPDYVLGLSIGAYPAAVIAGSLSLADALTLVDLRGRLMREAYPSGYGMLAVTGTARRCVEAAVARCQALQLPVYLANINAEYQFVLAGEHQGLQQAVGLIRAQGACSSTLLDVAVPSHCPLLARQAEQMLDACNAIEFQTPGCGYVSAARARVLYQPQAIREDLALNMARQVHWHDSSQMLAERGIRRVIEVPPGSTLTGLFRRVLPGGQCYAVASTQLATLLHGNRT